MQPLMTDEGLDVMHLTCLSDMWDSCAEGRGVRKRGDRNLYWGHRMDA